MLALVTSAKLKMGTPADENSLLAINIEGVGSKAQLRSILTHRFNPLMAVISCRKKKDLAANSKKQIMQKTALQLEAFLKYLQQEKPYQEAVLGLLEGLASAEDYAISYRC